MGSAAVGPAAVLASALMLSMVATAPVEGLRLAAIGDYGSGTAEEGEVAAMISSFAPVNEILALGDNNYVYGKNDTIDANVGQFFSSYISPYMGTYGTGSSTGNHFWPIPGNHDWGRVCADAKNGCVPTSCSAPGSLEAYHWYFPFLEGKNYYTQVFGDGLLEIFALDTDCNEPAGTTNASMQAAWLAGALAASTATWKLIIMHHAPYSSGGLHGSINRVQWGFENMGVDAVLNGHDHLYERILRPDGFPYFVNGIGGDHLYGFRATPEPGSAVRYNAHHGAQIIDIDGTTAEFRFYAATSPKPTLVDCFRINKVVGGKNTYEDCRKETFSLLTGGLASDAQGTNGNMYWRYNTSGVKQDAWLSPTYAAPMPVGATRFGYGNHNLTWTTPLPPAPAKAPLYYYFRTSFCLSAARKAWLAGQALTLKVMADNGADVYLNGAQLLADAASNHNPKYWNNQVPLPGNHTAFKQGTNWLTALVTNTPRSSDAAFDLDLTYSALAPYVEAPTKPQYLAAAAMDNRTLAVKWSQPACAGGSSSVRSYQVAVSPAPPSPVPAVKVIDPFRAAYLLYVRGLQPCTEYSIGIRAVSATARSAPATIVATTPCRRAGRE